MKIQKCVLKRKMATLKQSIKQKLNENMTMRIKVKENIKNSLLKNQ